jgi:hypothetical protein
VVRRLTSGQSIGEACTDTTIDAIVAIYDRITLSLILPFLVLYGVGKCAKVNLAKRVDVGVVDKPKDEVKAAVEQQI